jgi:hypothetical protein
MAIFGNLFDTFSTRPEAMAKRKHYLRKLIRSAKARRIEDIEEMIIDSIEGVASARPRP